MSTNKIVPARLNDRLKGLFLEVLMEQLQVKAAAAAIGFCPRTMYYAREKDPKFAAAWDEVDTIVTSRLEDEAIRRAHQGVSKPVFYQGKKCGAVQEYSDVLLMFVLKAREPGKYRERSDVKISAHLSLEKLINLSFEPVAADQPAIEHQNN